MNNLKRILLAEDDSKDVELILTALEEHKLANEVVVTHDGVEALDYCSHGTSLQVGRKEPAVMLLDLKMPKMDGLEVLRKIKSDAELKTLPVVVLTSSRESSDLDESTGSASMPMLSNRKVLGVRRCGQELEYLALINEPPSATVKNI